jgi:hypothetical protein
VTRTDWRTAEQIGAAPEDAVALAMKLEEVAKGFDDVAIKCAAVSLFMNAVIENADNVDAAFIEVKTALALMKSRMLEHYCGAPS